MPTEPLTPEEIAEGRQLILLLRTWATGSHPFSDSLMKSAAILLNRLLSAAERLAEVERQLAEARAVIVFDRHPDSDFTWKRPPFYAAAVEAAHAASRQPKEPEHE